MRVSLDWLKEYIDVKGDVKEIAHTLTMAGLEVEGIDHHDISFDKVVPARVDSLEGHPDADKLSVCSVSTSKESLTIVCGDQNVRPGDIVPLALPGAILPDGRVITVSKVKGVESEGMLCSEKELGITDNASGVMILPDDTQLDINLVDIVSDAGPQFNIVASSGAKKSKSVNAYSDSIFEVGLTPNRPDCLSLYGFARELSALTGNKPVFPAISIEEGKTGVDDAISIEIEEPSICNRYMARVIRGVEVKKSPLWLRRRLESAGVRSINSVVDTTNYVMLELGQPMHAFDISQIRGKKILVRKASDGESLKTLDGVERSFGGEELLICDAEGPLALAGVMGGDDSAVTDDTVDILLESAYFEPGSVRKTSKKHGLHTESSHRFERGVDIEGVIAALDRAALLISKLAGGEILSGSVDNYPVPYEKREISLRSGRCSEVLGVDLGEEEISGYLKALGMEVTDAGGSYKVVPPSYRVDIEREIDLIEEIARLKGYSSIPSKPLSGVMPEASKGRDSIKPSLIKSLMADSGYNEAINYSFQSPEELKKLIVPSEDPLNRVIKILNPISEDMSIMRSTLLPGLLNTAALNINRQNRNLQLFEMGKVFNSADNGYIERLRLCALMTGEKMPPLWKRGVNVYDLKGTLENLLDLMNLKDYTFTNCSDIPHYHPGKGARTCIGGEEIATLGELHPSIAENYEIGQNIYLFDIDLTAIEAFRGEKKFFRDIPAYPFVERDVALLVDKGVAMTDIMNGFQKLETALVENIEIFDSFEGEAIGASNKSLAFRIRYRSAEKTLTDLEVSEMHEDIVAHIVKEVGATVR